MTNLATLFQKARNAYLARDAGLDAYLRSIDFHLRSLCLVTAGHLAARSQPLLLDPSPGLGSHISYLKAAAGQSVLTRTSGRLLASISAAVNSATIILPGQTIPNIERLRNHLFHGGTIPAGQSGDRLVDDVRSMEEAISQAVVELLTFSRVAPAAANSALTFTIDGVTSHLFPLIKLSRENVQVFARLTSKGAQYICPGSPSPRLVESDEVVLSQIRSLVRFAERDRALADLVEWVRDDLRAFANPDHELHFFVDGGIVTFSWVRQMSSSDEKRSDAFQLGPDDQRQWRREDNGWIPYSELLRTLSMWPRLAERLRQQFGSHTCLPDISTRVAPKVIMRNLDFTVAATDFGDEMSGRTSEELLKAGDEALTRNRGQTLIIFLAGEAGIGKTSCLIKAAVERARQVEQEPALALPLYLYVSSAGNVLAQLENVIQAAVAPTRNLTKDSVLALCRNGLMIILIDGFDELVGGTTYSDAFGSLRPWMEDLGGRGVMIVSARSSYYLQQYQRSVAENMARGVAASHLIAELQKWTSDEVATYFEERHVPWSTWGVLPPDQRDLLCIPFYATELAKWWNDTERHDRLPPQDLRELLIVRFLERESNKLQIPGTSAHLLTLDELRAVCTNLAWLMAQNQEREVGLLELEFAVEEACEGALDGRPGLRQRLTVLCSLGVHGETDPRFTFSHALYFDCFLGEALTRYLSNRPSPALKRILEGTLLKRATIDIVAIDKHRLVETLQAAGSPASDVGRHNFGQVWASLLDQGISAPFGALTSLRFDELDLSGNKPKVHLIDCEIQQLYMDVPGAAHVVERCMIDQLVVRRLDGGKRAELSLVDGIVRAVRTPQVYEDTPVKVQQILAGLGLTQVQAAEQGNIEAYEFFLDRISSRAELSVVLRAADLLGDDQRLRWTEVYGRHVWQLFVKSLVDFELAELVAFPGSGESKRRLRFRVSAQAVRNRVKGEGDVDGFWQEAAR